ncbi:MAG: hypothetical protein AAGD06_01740 [Acidobacteriota bacterium]
MTRYLAPLALCILLASPASAVTFSFASDDNHDGPTFHGAPTFSTDDITDAAQMSVDSTVNVDLMVDLNDDKAGGVVTFQATMTFGGSIQIWDQASQGGKYLHSWEVSEGTIHFAQLGTGTPILTITFESGMFSSFSPQYYYLGSTATLQSSEEVDSSIRFTAHPLLQGIGVSGTQLSTSEDFAFTFTNVRIPNGSSLPLIRHFLFWDSWVSGGSFSAFAKSPIGPSL